MQADEPKGKLYDGQMLRRLAVYLKPYKASVAGTLVLVTLHGLFDSLGPLLTRYAVDRYFTHSPVTKLPFELPADPYNGLTILTIAYLTVVILTLLSEFGMTLLMNRTAQHAMFDLRRDLFTHLHRLDIAYFDRNPIGRIVTRVTSDVDMLNELFSSGFVAILGDLLMLLWLLQKRTASPLQMMMINFKKANGTEWKTLMKFKKGSILSIFYWCNKLRIFIKFDNIAPYLIV